MPRLPLPGTLQIPASWIGRRVKARFSIIPTILNDTEMRVMRIYYGLLEDYLKGQNELVRVRLCEW